MLVFAKDRARLGVPHRDRTTAGGAGLGWQKLPVASVRAADDRGDLIGLRAGSVVVDVMQINADFEQRVVRPPPCPEDWVPSPMTGVHRYLLDRVGGEIARATSLVRYAAGSRFARHEHGGGEEILVLDGVFSDERGDHPAGTYLRNPPGSGHAPFSRDGCTLFVKLWQFARGDLRTVRTDTRSADWHPGLVPGLTVMPLHDFDGISTALVRWAPDTQFSSHAHPGGEEIFVLEGMFRDEHGEYPAGSWLRNPRWSRHTPFTGPEGALIYVKVGHLGAELLTPQVGHAPASKI